MTLFAALVATSALVVNDGRTLESSSRTASADAVAGPQSAYVKYSWAAEMLALRSARAMVSVQAALSEGA